MKNLEQKKEEVKKVQVDCRKLSEEQIQNMCSVVEGLGFKIWGNPIALKIVFDECFFRMSADYNFAVFTATDSLKTITYYEFMLRFGTFNPQQHYDNSKGSLYKVGTERGWNPYLFDIVKRLERGGKKDPLEQEIDKTIDVLKIWKSELNK